MSPTYDYGCTQCENRFEKMLSVDSRYKPTEEPCPSCGAEGTVEFLILGAPVVAWSFAGSTIQSSNKTPEGFKDILRRIKKSKGGATPGIEL